jgi:hypothetical protein
MAAFAQSDFGESAALFTKALEIKPGDAEVVEAMAAVEGAAAGGGGGTEPEPAEPEDEGVRFTSSDEEEGDGDEEDGGVRFTSSDEEDGGYVGGGGSDDEGAVGAVGVGTAGAKKPKKNKSKGADAVAARRAKRAELKRLKQGGLIAFEAEEYEESVRTLSPSYCREPTGPPCVFGMPSMCLLHSTGGSRLISWKVECAVQACRLAALATALSGGLSHA